jgi:AcrR family transcriptional regulator
VNELIVDEHPAAISMPAVAARAGVAVATVYRYFPTKEALLDAAASEVVPSQADKLPRSIDEIGPALRTTWSELANELPLVRGQHASPVGRELHRRRSAARREAAGALIAAEGVDPESATGRRMLGLLDVLTSSTAMLELHDKAGVPVADAADWCAWAVNVLYRATKRSARR